MSMLNKLIVEVKDAWVSYPGIAGFEVQLAYHSRPRLVKMRKDCMITKIDRKTRVPMEVLDEDRFVEEFANSMIKGWKGLTLEGLQDLLAMNLSDQDLTAEVPYTKEDALILVKNSSEFETWLNEVVFDLQNFRTKGD